MLQNILWKNVCIDGVSQDSLDSNVRHETVWNRVSRTALLQDRLWRTSAFQIPSNRKLVGFASSLSTKAPSIPQEVFWAPLSYHNPAQYETNQTNLYNVMQCLLDILNHLWELLKLETQLSRLVY